MQLGLEGKRVLISGGSKGIGLAAAETLAEEGCEITLVARDQAVLDAAAAVVEKRSKTAVRTIAADLTSDAAIRDVAQQAGDIDILVNNAGAIPPGGLLAVDDEAWRRAWDLKVFGFIALTRAVYPGMAARKSGVIVNIIGNAGENPDSAYLVGATGNAALMAFTRGLGRGASKDGIRVVGINPGPTLTARLERQFRERALKTLGDAARWPELCEKLPFGRPARPEEVANAVAFLASPRSAYTNATILTIDGGPV
jgi:NAD(P)-dependent dehydrogenase (short-subunit alcohol dehydrogenase family)